jgi:hypothetical protein
VRKLFWGIVGIGAGVVIGAAVVRWANRTKARYSPPNLAREASGKLGDLGGRFREAIRAGRDEMTAREMEIREELGLPPR